MIHESKGYDAVKPDASIGKQRDSQPTASWIRRKLFAPATTTEIEDDARRSTIPDRPIVALIAVTVSAAVAGTLSLGVIRFLMLRSR